MHMHVRMHADEHIGALAMSETGSGSDVCSMKLHMSIHS
jgi:hypothetical protein